MSESIAEVLSGARAWHVEHGDALRLLATLPDACIDALVTDPPYCSGGLHAGDRARSPLKKYMTTGTRRTYPDFAGDQCDQHSFLAGTALWLSECRRVLKPGAPMAVFTDWRQLPSTSDAIQVAGFRWRGTVPWDKTEQVRPQLGGFRAQAEFILWGSKGPLERNRGVGALPGAYRVPVRAREKLHVTGKPVELMRQIVRVCSPGGIVLDPFAGSASTGMGCLLEGYRFLGLEVTEAYAQISVERLGALEAELRAAPAGARDAALPAGPRASAARTRPLTVSGSGAHSPALSPVEASQASP